jgi:hypothetical protein
VRAPLTTAGFRKMVARLGVAAKFKFPVHLGHKNIPHTFRGRTLGVGRAA